MLVMGGVTCICFLGGWLSPFRIGILPDGIWFSLKIYFFAILFVVKRAILPRYRVMTSQRSLVGSVSCHWLSHSFFFP